MVVSDSFRRPLAVERLTTPGTTGEVASVLTLTVCVQASVRLGARADDECRDAIRRIAQA